MHGSEAEGKGTASGERNTMSEKEAKVKITQSFPQSGGNLLCGTIPPSENPEFTEGVPRFHNSLEFLTRISVRARNVLAGKEAVNKE